jgi:hypothetical protein
VPLIDPDLKPPEPFSPTDFGRVLPPELGEGFELPEDEGPPEPEEEITELSEEERYSFMQLSTIGQRFGEIDIMGFKVGIQSLRVSDDLRISLFCKDYDGTKMEQRATQVAVCAAGIREVNGAPLVPSLGPMTADERFKKQVDILKEYYPLVITKVYRAIMELDQEFVELAAKLGKLSG